VTERPRGIDPGSAEVKAGSELGSSDGASEAGAARALAHLLEGLERAGTTVMDLVRRGQPKTPWRLYPGEAGIFDRRTHCQFYYHSHEGRPEEAGHFHTVRLFPDHTVHLVAISMAPDGWPQALFTVNQWATGDAWEPAATIARYVREFHVDERRGPREVVRFVNLVFRAFRREIEQLQEEKVAALLDHQRRHPDRNARDDRRLEILSRVSVDVRRAVAPAPAGGR